MKYREDEFKALITMLIGFIMVIMVIIVPFVACLNIATEYSKGIGLTLFFLGSFLFLVGIFRITGTN